MSCSTVCIDDNQVALLLVFPATNLVLCKEYNVLPDLRKAGQFIAALLPWKIVGKKARSNRLHRDPNDRTPQEVIPATERDLNIRKDPSYHRAFSILGFPKWLYNDLSDPEFKYCIWNKDGDGTQTEPGSETMALKHILKQRPAKDVGLKADAFIVFVHVGALRTLQSLPALMERRMKRPDVQFITYGTHHTIPPARWGMRSIYPLGKHYRFLQAAGQLTSFLTTGGIATISPSVFVECPSAAYKLLDMLEQHPLWDCFVTPGVVALAARQNQGSDPISEFERYVAYLLRLQGYRPSCQREVNSPGALISDWAGTAVVTQVASSLWVGRKRALGLDSVAAGDVYARSARDFGVVSPSFQSTILRIPRGEVDTSGS